MLSGRGADHSSRGVLPSVVCLECDHEASIMRRPWPTGGCCAVVKKNPYILLGGGGDNKRRKFANLVVASFPRI